jgi:hypothetical protein
MLRIVIAPTSDADCPLVETPKRRLHRPNMYGEARELQLLVLKHSRDKTLKPFVVSNLVRAYRELAELRLRLQGKGPPKAVDYGDRRKQRKAKPQGFTEAPGEGKPAAAKAQSAKSKQIVNDTEK